MREIWILALLGLLLFLGVTVFHGIKAFDAPEFVIRGVQDFGLSPIGAVLVIAIIEVRASREQIERSLDLISEQARRLMSA